MLNHSKSQFCISHGSVATVCGWCGTCMFLWCRVFGYWRRKAEV